MTETAIPLLGDGLDGSVKRFEAMAKQTGNTVAATVAASSVDLALWGGAFFLWLLPLHFLSAAGWKVPPLMLPPLLLATST